MIWLAVGCIGGLLLLLVTTIGWAVQPWAPWWVAQRGGSAGSIQLGDSGLPTVNGPVVQVPVIVPSAGGGVTDADRYRLARAAGFNGADAITAVAISIAED